MTNTDTGRDIRLVPGEEFVTGVCGFGLRFALQIDLSGEPPE